MKIISLKSITNNIYNNTKLFIKKIINKIKKHNNYKMKTYLYFSLYLSNQMYQDFVFFHLDLDCIIRIFL